MTSDESELVEFYANARLPDGQADAILAAGRSAADARRWRRIGVSTSIGLAVAAVLAGWLFVRAERHRGSIATDASLANTAPGDDILHAGVSPVDIPEPRRETPSFRFVAFRSHNDGCPRCRATGELYAELLHQMDATAIEFEQFELQKTDVLDETMERIASNNLTEFVADRDETAFALLLSPAGNPLQRFDPAVGIDPVLAAIQDVIEQ